MREKERERERERERVGERTKGVKGEQYYFVYYSQRYDDLVKKIIVKYIFTKVCA